MEPPQGLVALEASQGSLFDLAQALVADAEHGRDFFARVRAFVGHVERAVTGGRELVLGIPAVREVVAALPLFASSWRALVTAAGEARIPTGPNALGLRGRARAFEGPAPE